MVRLDGLRVVSIVVVALIGAVAWSGRWLTTRRTALRDARAGARIFVTTAADEGIGSLREAIFAADRADRHATLVMRTSRVVLETELPPLVNPHGVDIDATASSTEIDAHKLAGRPVLQILSPESRVEGLRISGAAGTALLVRAPRVRLRGLLLAECAEGITLGNGASDVLVEESRFEANGAGLNIPLAVPGVIVRKNQFSRHEQAGIRAVVPEPSSSAASAGLIVRANQFEDDRISVLLIHIGSRVEQNTFRGAREAAIFVMGRGAIVRENRTREGAGLGIFADETEDALIEENELDHNAAVGILVRAGGGTLTRANRVYQNGYGIAVVFGDDARPHVVRDNLLLDQTQDAMYIVGASPLIWENRALRNRVAGARILDFVPLDGPRLPSRPRLADNVFKDNLIDAPVRGLYRVRPSEVEAER